ncbi:SDR family NAD(P)-dependent oxidoreductase [Allostreptomyces psammosilenae]|uniref:NAD(P)-dependent dehydrogenase (Short-subunit alcohol dehydrogenase family) n=1 Tax=Allostreptomyces psammosilenae TaxID=1892865 RepID=A0A852ZTM8_9ACTN|nr:SDR family NAD(P)-dependent oxidoreductase [Allostreptomyces psammosilenae]NYI04907.1 NAD(P)-dependent dehydrogenase (short-subunit alcohol dehydrogenase family) [Allostreptomyces psammosilenae]
MADSRAVFITGAAGGIGTATVKALVERGFQVYAGVRGEAPHLRGSNVELVQVDVTDPDSVAAAAKEVGRRLGGRGLHALINNAGIIVQGPLELLSPSEVRKQFEVNVFGVVETTRAFLPLVRKGQGRIINLSAATARTAMPYLGAISASKAALESFSSVARVELAPWKIPVVIIEPGAVDTTLLSKSGAAAQANLASEDPERVTLYANQLEAIQKAMAGQKPSPVKVVTDVVVKAVEANRPKPLYTAGSDARLLGFLSRLPLGVRDRMLTNAMGLNKVSPASTGTTASR